MSEVSGTCGMFMAFCVHPMCSDCKTTCWLYLKNKSSQILYASQVQVSYLGQCMRGKSSTSTWLSSRVFEYIVTWTQLCFLPTWHPIFGYIDPITRTRQQMLNGRRCYKAYWTYQLYKSWYRCLHWIICVRVLQKQAEQLAPNNM